jgi:drug/metabolite transporter (DMT)-like permease
MITSREKFGPLAAWASVCFFWGTTYLAIRIGLETLPPLLFGGLRFLTAGVLLMTITRAWSGASLPRGREWLDQTLVGLLLLGVGNGLVVWAEQWVPSGPAALLVATSPFWVMGVERTLREGERLSGRAVLGLLVGFTGLALLVAPNLYGANLGGGYLWGMLALQGACAAWSIGSVYAKHHRTGVTPLMGAAVQMVIAGAALTLIGTVMGEWEGLSFSPRSLGAFSYLVVFGSIVAYGSYTYAVQKLPLSLVSTYSYINPVIAVLLGWIILDEQMNWRVITAMLVILSGVMMVKGVRVRRAGRKVSGQKSPAAKAEAGKILKAA